MLVYRIGRRRFARSLTGRGAELYPGRWNNELMPVLYCADSRALCALELLVHLDRSTVPADHTVTTLMVPDDAPILIPATGQLPQGWNNAMYSDAARAYGDRFIRSRTHLVLRVPSAVLPDEYNFLLNPLHPDMSRVKVVSVARFVFDPRLFKKS